MFILDIPTTACSDAGGVKGQKQDGEVLDEAESIRLCCTAMKHPAILSLLLALFASGCASIAGEALPESVHGMVGGEYFTRHGLRQEKNRWRSTNYGRGTLVPINTKVRVDSITSSAIKLTIVASGKALKLSNIEKYTGGGVDLLAERTLSAEPTDLSGFEFQKDIKVGRLRLGMTEEEAILAAAVPKSRRIANAFEELQQLEGVERVRSLGMVAALDLAGDAGYLADAGWRVYDEARRRGAYLRPLGNVIYVTPSLNIPDEDLDRLLTIVQESVSQVLRC